MSNLIEKLRSSGSSLIDKLRAMQNEPIKQITSSEGILTYTGSTGETGEDKTTNSNKKRIK